MRVPHGPGRPSRTLSGGLQNIPECPVLPDAPGPEAGAGAGAPAAEGMATLARLLQQYDPLPVGSPPDAPDAKARPCRGAGRALPGRPGCCAASK